MDTMKAETRLAPWMQEKMNELLSHPAWNDSMTGFEADALLRTQQPFTYLLRQGERKDVFYLSFCTGTAVVHRPFSVDYATYSWYYRNGFPQCRQVFKPDLKTFIPEIIQREEAECLPLPPFINV